MTTRWTEKLDTDFPHFLYSAPRTYDDYICEKCGQVCDDLYDLNGYEVCLDCLKKDTIITKAYA